MQIESYVGYNKFYVGQRKRRENENSFLKPRYVGYKISVLK